MDLNDLFIDDALFELLSPKQILECVLRSIDAGHDIRGVICQILDKDHEE